MVSATSVSSPFECVLPARQKGVIERQFLRHDDLVSLLAGHVLPSHGGRPVVALIVKKYYPRCLCDKFTSLVRERFTSYSGEQNANEVKKLDRCQALYERQEDYFEGAAECHHHLRELAPHGILPLDRLQAELDREWRAGSQILRISGDTARFGLIRAIPGEARPHVDDARRDRPDLPGIEQVCGQFAANVFLDVPAAGGELSLWSETPSPGRLKELAVVGDYGLNRDLLGSPAVVIKPQVGDLVLFNARKPHAVSDSHGQYRISQSGFIGFRSMVDKLQLFS